MPLVDGIKMACASCIRGHRSQRCEHHDRPLLKLRNKGRPMTSQCDVCRDLRKALGVHTRCVCERDVSEAPKRKEMVKKSEVERILDHPERRASNDTTIVRSAPQPHTPILEGSSLSVPFRASIPFGDESSQTVRLNDDGTSTVCTSGPNRCCARPSASPDATSNELGKFPMDLSHPTRSIDASRTRVLETEPYRRTPHLQDVQIPYSAYGELSSLSEISRNIHRQAQAPDSFDSETLALWDQFLGDEQGREETAGMKSVANVPNPFRELPTLSTPTDLCRPESCCESCIPDGNCCEMSALCISLGCFRLSAGMERIEDFPAANDDASMIIPPLSQSTTNQMEPDYSQVFSVLDSWHSDTLATGIPAQPGSEAVPQGFVSTAPCICEESCACPICDVKRAEDMLSWELCEFCVACLFCVDSTAGLRGTL